MNQNLNPGQGQQSYVPKIDDQNIIFYSLHPKDIISKQFLETLNKNPLLDRQFIKICVYPNFQNIRIPQKILDLNKVPVLVPAGFPEPISGEDALSWLNNNAMTAEKSNGFDYGAIEDNSFSQKFSSLANEFEQTDYNQVWNDEYNLGFAKGPSNKINQAFSGIKNVDHISTYDDTHESKKGISDKMMMKMNQMKFNRDREVPQTPKRIGGLDMMDSGNGNTITGLMNSPMQYNPNLMGGGMGGGMGSGMGGGMGMQGGSAPQYNPNMPQMPQMPQMPGGRGMGMQTRGMQGGMGGGLPQYNPNVNMSPGGGRGMGGGPPQYNPNVNIPPGGGMGGGPPQYNPNVNMPPGGGMGRGMGGGPPQYNPNPNAPIGGGNMPRQQMNLPQNRGNMPQMPQRPFADRTTGSNHGGGNFPSPMNMPGGPQGSGMMQQAARGSMPMGLGGVGTAPSGDPVGMGGGPMAANLF